MNEYGRLAKQFQALTHPTRLQILDILRRGPACVCNLVELTGKRQSHISQHLSTLRKADLVSTSHQGWYIFYRLNSSKLAELQAAVGNLSQFKREADETLTPPEYCNDGQAIACAKALWYPIVNLELCSGCQSCIDDCPGDVYDWNKTLGRPIMARPENCANLCTSCATACPEGAITFPNQAEMVEPETQ